MSAIILRYSLDDLAFDYRQVNARLRAFCREHSCALHGMAATEHEVLILAETGHEARETAHFAPLPDGMASLEGEIFSHYQGDNLMLGLVQPAKELYLCLYKKPN